MSKEIIIDFCKTAEDALNVFNRRKDDYKLSFKLNDISLVDLNLAKNNQHQLLDTTPVVNESVTYYQIQIWTLNI